MRILSLSNTALDPLLGSGKTVLHWTAELRARGHECRAVGGDGLRPQWWRGPGKRFGVAWGGWRELQRQERAFRPELVEFYGGEFGWASALAEGYAKLELVLMERAIKGTPKLVRASSGKDKTMREYSPALAIALLRRHAEVAGKADAARPPDDEMDEVREAILEKLERMRARELGEVETKGWLGRIELIEWALGLGEALVAAPLSLTLSP